MMLNEYREKVIRAVACPYCLAEPRHGCTKPTRFMLRPTTAAVPYVHDDRSAVYHGLTLLSYGTLA